MSKSWVLCAAVLAGLGCNGVDFPESAAPADAPVLAARTPPAIAGLPAVKSSAFKAGARALPRDTALQVRASARLPRLADGLATLFDDAGAPLGARDAARAAALRGIRLADDRVQVVAHLSSPRALERGDVTTLAGAEFRVDASADGQVQGWVRLADLPRLSRDPAVLAVTVPVLPKTTAITSEGVAKMNVPAVAALNIKGQGQKIGILDVGFQGYAALLGTELPASVVTKSYYGAAPGDITGAGEVHGVAVAEVVYDVAPQAALYLVNYDSEVTFKTAVDWLIAQGVDVITTSTGTYAWENTDGTGPVAAKANAARDAGIVFTAAAGNSGDSHYRATFTPSSVAEFHKFYLTGPLAGMNVLVLAEDGAGGAYYLPPNTPIIVDLVWDDWGTNNGTPTSTVDYDLYLAMYDETVDPGTGQPVGWTIVAASEDVQGGAAFPRESIGVYTPATPTTGAVYGLVVAKKVATAANKPFDLYITNVFSDLNLFGPDILVPSQSVITPCVGAKVQCIGAVDINDALLAYSSQGPSHPNAGGTTIPKPDFAAPSEVSTSTYPKNASNPAGFGGTSGATPHAAGVAALFLQLANGDPTVAETQMRTAAVDLGVAGRDNIYGYGRVRAVPCWPALCDDGLACTTDTCNTTTGCQHAASGTGCFIGGACVAHGAVNPLNPCQKCDQAAPTVWSSVVDGTACAADANDCTLDQCQAGNCIHPTAPNGTPCTDDGTTCTSDLCQTGACTHAVATGCLIAGTCVANGAANPLNACQKCDHAAPTQWSSLADGTACAPDANDCTLDQCQAGTCVHPTAPNNTPCTDDGAACTTDLCQGGACAHAITGGCFIAGTCYAAGAENPDNPCQQCAPANKTQWTNKPNTTPCEDGLFCTTGDTCTAGACQSGLPRDCSAVADDCNTASCNESTDLCVKVAKTDLVPCTGDGDNCTLDRCQGGACTHPALPNDCGGRACGASPNGCYQCGTCPTGYGCGSDGQCSDLCANVTCPECQACNAGACVPANEGAACTADANACTQDVCAAGACAHPAVSNGLPCDDSNACTRTDTCQAGACTGANPVTCTALDACHDVGTCQTNDGSCTNPPKAEGTPCGDDGNACTADQCASGACVHPNVTDGTACTDGNACTQTDTCVAGTCTGGNPVACPAPAECRSQGTCDTATGQCSNPSEADGVPCGDDGNECTADACLAGSCSHTARTDGTPCADEGLSCTADACTAGACTHVRQAGCIIDGACVAAGTLRPDNACESCQESSPTAWTALADGTACPDEGLFCTKDACTAGACTHAREAGCIIDGACRAAGETNPLNPCEACQETNPAAWSVVANGTSCDDGAFCTLDETCQGGTCTAGSQRDCSAEDGPCATGTCSDADDACVAAPKAEGTPCGDAYDCSDGLLTKADSCHAGLCVDAGTVDCAPYAGCVSEGVCRTSCSTGADCLSGNRCVSGACGANRAPVADAGDDVTVDEGELVTLDGTGSSDPDGDLLAFAWTQEGEPVVSLDDPAIAGPSFTAPEVGAETVLVFRLVAKDGLLDSPYDEVRVTVRDVPKPPEGEDVVNPPEGEDAVTPADVPASDNAGQDTAAGDTATPTDVPADAARDNVGPEGTTMDVPLAEVPGDTGGTDTGTGKKGGGCTAGGASPATLAPVLLALAAFATRRRRRG